MSYLPEVESTARGTTSARCLIAILSLVLMLGVSLRAAEAAGEAGGSSDPHRLAAKVFKEHNCGSCHTLGNKGQFGYTAHGLEIKKQSLGCVALLTQMTQLTSVPEERWSTDQQAKVHAFHEFGCTQCHQMTGHGMEMTKLGTQLRSAHLSCPEVEKVLNSR
jgi:hypothetical protein